MKWEDKRLKYDESIGDNMQRNGISVPPDDIPRFWMPDIFFRNEIKAELHDLTKSNRLMKIYPNGTVWYACR